MIRYYLSVCLCFIFLLIRTFYSSARIFVLIGISLRLFAYSSRTKGWTLSLINSLAKFFYSSEHRSRTDILFTYIFLFVIITNMLGLYSFSHHIILNSVSLVLVFLVIFLWRYSYECYFSKGWGSLATSLVVNITYPTLSLLLRNIEVLTHLFRPITLMARMWVNIWVGHSILSLLSFISIKSMSEEFNFKSSSLVLPIVQGSLLIYELIIIFLQSAVIVYLSFVYYRDNVKATKH